MDAATRAGRRCRSDRRGHRIPAPERRLPEPSPPQEVERRRPIGEIFVELGFITSDQLEAALDVQRQTGGRIGEILVEQGSLTRLDLASALAEHWEPRGPAVDAGTVLSSSFRDPRRSSALGWSARTVPRSPSSSFASGRPRNASRRRRRTVTVAA